MQQTGSPSKTRWRRFIAGSVVFGLLILLAWRLCFPGQPFDQAAWQADATVLSGVRQRMADRLLARNSLIGLTREETVALLGAPFEDGPFRDADLVYLLGVERGFIRLDNEWLVLQLGPDGRVLKAQLTTD